MNLMAATVTALISTRTHNKPINKPPIIQDSLLLNLPRELRDHILSYILVEPPGVMLVYNSKSRHGYDRAMRVSFTYGLGRMGRRFGPPPGIEVFGVTDCYQYLMKMVQLCRQTNDEAQEMFFWRNRFIFYTPYGVPSILKMHARWLSKVSFWCRPSVGEAKLIWMHVVVERTQDRPFWKVTWKLFRYNDEEEDEALNRKLLVWTQNCEELMLMWLQVRKEVMDLEAIVDTLSEPPMCRRMDVSIFPESKPRR